MENRRRLPPIARPTPATAPPPASWTPWTPAPQWDWNMAVAEYVVAFELPNPELRERALRFLAQRNGTYRDLGPLLWFSHGTIASLLQDIVSIYRSLQNPIFLQVRARRAFYALKLLQRVAMHNNTWPPLMNAYIPSYVYPFLNTTRSTGEYEHLRIASLGLIAALVKDEDSEGMNFLITAEVIPPCLHSMEMGRELSKTVATSIVLKIMSSEARLGVICRSPAHFYSVANVLAQMVAKRPSQRLMRKIIFCYLRLASNPRACNELGNCLPVKFRNDRVHRLFQDDFMTRRCLDELLSRVAMGSNTSVPNNR